MKNEHKHTAELCFYGWIIE